MKNLLYKEFKLSIHPLYYLVPLLGGLLLIPNWLYFIAMFYVFFITITNVFANSKAQNDLAFSVMLPVRKRDIVKARILSIVTIELIHILVAVIFAIINQRIYDSNFFLEPNAAFFGFVLIAYGIFNVIFFPMFYKTGYKIGLPAILAIAVALILAALVEVTSLMVPAVNLALDSSNSDMVIYKVLTLVIGIIVFALFNIIAYKVSAKRFEMIDV